MAKKPTLRDVSRTAGVSSYTASRALSNGSDVAKETRQRVLKIARELGYIPNRAAQELRKNTRRSVAVITASASNYYYINMMKGVQRTLRSTGRAAVVVDIAAEGVYTPELEDATIQDLIQSRTAGVIATLTLSLDSVELLDKWDIPVVFVDCDPPVDATTVPAITMNNFAASVDVGAHLAGHGYRDWLFLAYPGHWSTRVDRERGIRHAAERYRAGLEVVESENDVESAYKTLSAHLDHASLPRAIIAANNPMVHGALRVLHERSFAVPDQVALIGYDDFDWAPLLNPALTVLDQNSEDIGVQAAQILTRIIEDQIRSERDGRPLRPVYQSADRREVEPHLIVRRSCGC